MVRIVDDINKAKFITHSGVLHADEVFATAFLDLYFGDVSLIRVREVSNNIKEDTIVYDIGKGKFDHHQIDAKVRDNGIKYSSFGLIFEEYGIKYLEKLGLDKKEDVYNYFVKNLVEGIDAIDNGVFPIIEANYKVKTVSDIIKLFNPSYLSNDDVNDNFLKAVDIAKAIITYEIKNVYGKVMASVKVKELLDKSDGPILVLDEFLPYEETILSSSKYDKIKLVVFPSNRGGYAINTIPISSSDKTSRVYFPKAWGGLYNKKLEEATGVKGAIFCHVNRFILTADTFDAALKLADITIDVNETN